MIDQLINNFYFQNFLYTLVLSLVSIILIKNKKDNFKNKLGKNIDYKFLIKMLSLSLFGVTFLQTIIIYFNLGNFTNNLGITELVIYGFVSCLISPIVEEIIIRFGIFETLNKRLNVFLTIFITSLIFAFAHMTNIEVIIILLYVSIIWTYAYYKKSNIIYSILLHCFHNIYSIINEVIKINAINYLFLSLFFLMIFIVLSIKKRANI